MKTRWNFLLILALLTFSTVVTVTVHAAGTLFVKPTATGSGDCSNWDNACTLQTALTGATSGDEIWVAAGIYKPTTVTTDRAATFQLKNGVAVYGGFSGTETLRTERNTVVNVTILSGDIDNNDSQTPVTTSLAAVTGNTTNSYHVVTSVTGAILDGFTITAGYANGDSFASFGGGMFNHYSSSPTLESVTFSGNSGVIGGGMYNHYYSSPTLTNVTFSGNSAGSGGGMFNNYYSSPTLTNVTFSGNSAGNGGGMYNDHSNLTLTNITFSGNSVTDYGGGMFNDYSSPTLTNVTFSNNSAYNGGGMFNRSSSPTLTNVTFSSNSAAYAAGGMFNQSYSSPTLTNVTFSNNSAYNGGGIYNISSSPTLRNVIIANSTNFDCRGSALNAASVNNLIESSDIDACNLANGVNGNVTGMDPKLGTLGDYGGSTQTIPLLPGSPAIDAGNDSVCPATDQRGVARPQSAHCDIGAHEVEITDTTPPAITRGVVGTLGDNGWYTSDVHLTWSVIDDESIVTATGCDPVDIVSDQLETSYTCSATSAGGTSSETVTIKRDATPPTLNPSVSPNPILLNGSTTVSPDASDVTSGIASTSCDAVITSSVGLHTINCTTTDNAGNHASASTTYDVIYDFVGFSSPVDNLPVLNLAKAGQTIPLKWRVVDANGIPVTNLTSVTVNAVSLSCSVGTTADLIEEYAAGGSGLQNLGNGYYQWNWKTPTTYVNSCKTLKLDLGDGLVHTALFQFKK